MGKWFRVFQLRVPHYVLNCFTFLLSATTLNTCVELSSGLVAPFSLSWGVCAVVSDFSLGHSWSLLYQFSVEVVF